MNAAMVDQADHWIKIGEMSLGIKRHKLNIIMKDSADVGNCLIEMLAEWLRNNPTPTWTDVVKAICSVDQKAAANVAQKLKGILYDKSC